VYVGAAVLDLLSLVQELTRGQAHTPELWVVTEDAQPVDAVVDPNAAAVLGLCQVIPQEHPEITCHGVDFAAGTDPDRVAAALLAELASPPEEPEIAYRGADRYVPSFEPLETGEVTTPVRPGGVYLVAGAGRMGLAIAERIAECGGGRIALVTRGSTPDTTRLRALGAEVLTAHADLADEARMTEVVADVTGRWGPVNGVVHAAGIEAGGTGFTFIADTTPEHARNLLRPKTTGISVVDRVTRGQPLDFALVCGSLSAVLGGITFGVYTAANRYLDAYAEARRAAGAPWVSADWDVWRFATTPAGLGTAVSRTAMSVEAATGLLGPVIATGHARVAVSTTPLAERIDRVRESFRRVENTGDDGARQEVASAAQLCDHLKQIVGDLVGLSDVDDEDELLAIGCDSLTFLKALARWENRIGVKVPIARLWGCRTFADLAEVGWQVVSEERTVRRDAGRQALCYLAG
jgi:aryl carrier-like protein